MITYPPIETRVKARTPPGFFGEWFKNNCLFRHTTPTDRYGNQPDSDESTLPLKNRDIDKEKKRNLPTFCLFSSFRPVLHCGHTSPLPTWLDYVVNQWAGEKITLWRVGPRGEGGKRGGEGND